MYATLEQFLKMSKEDQAKVTHLDLSIATSNDRAKVRSNVWQDDFEEYPGERREREPWSDRW